VIRQLFLVLLFLLLLSIDLSKFVQFVVCLAIRGTLHVHDVATDMLAKMVLEEKCCVDSGFLLL
jgi:hypothetical protein